MLIKWSSSIYYRDSPLYYPNSTYTTGRYSCTCLTLEATSNSKKTKKQKSANSGYCHHTGMSSTFTLPPPPLPTYLNLFTPGSLTCFRQIPAKANHLPDSCPSNTTWKSLTAALQQQVQKSALLKAVGPSATPPATTYLEEGTQSKFWSLRCCHPCSKAFPPYRAA